MYFYIKWYNVTFYSNKMCMMFQTNRAISFFSKPTVSRVYICDELYEKKPFASFFRCVLRQE